MQEVNELWPPLIAQRSALGKIGCLPQHILRPMFEYDAGSRKPGDPALMDYSEKMLKIGGKPNVYVIIDTLDECPNDAGWHLMKDV